MKTLIALLTLPLLFGCVAWNEFSDAMFGADTKKTIEWCDDDGKCTQVTIDGDQSDMAQMLSVAAQLYGLQITVVEE